MECAALLIVSELGLAPKAVYKKHCVSHVLNSESSLLTTCFKVPVLAEIWICHYSKYLKGTTWEGEMWDHGFAGSQSEIRWQLVLCLVRTVDTWTCAERLHGEPESKQAKTIPTAAFQSVPLLSKKTERNLERAGVMGRAQEGRGIRTLSLASQLPGERFLRCVLVWSWC